MCLVRLNNWVVGGGEGGKNNHRQWQIHTDARMGG